MGVIPVSTCGCLAWHPHGGLAPTYPGQQLHHTPCPGLDTWEEATSWDTLTAPALAKMFHACSLYQRKENSGLLDRKALCLKKFLGTYDYLDVGPHTEHFT